MTRRGSPPRRAGGRRCPACARRRCRALPRQGIAGRWRPPRAVVGRRVERSAGPELVDDHLTCNARPWLSASRNSSSVRGSGRRGGRATLVPADSIPNEPRHRIVTPGRTAGPTRRRRADSRRPVRRRGASPRWQVCGAVCRAAASGRVAVPVLRRRRRALSRPRAREPRARVRQRWIGRSRDCGRVAAQHLGNAEHAGEQDRAPVVARPLAYPRPAGSTRLRLHGSSFATSSTAA